jgi:hypothetical protein
MSMTLLEFVVAGVLLVVAWQIGITIAPWIIQRIRGLKDELDEVADEVQAAPTEKASSNHEEESNSKHKYRNN